MCSSDLWAHGASALAASIAWLMCTWADDPACRRMSVDGLVERTLLEHPPIWWIARMALRAPSKEILSATPATVYPNGTVTGCWPPLGVRLEILGTGALTDGVRELNETLVGTEWVVFVSSDANPDCPVYPPCPGPPGPKNRNNFFQLSIGWILGATLIPGFIGWVLGFVLGLKLVPPIKYHLVPHDVFQVGYTERIEME